MSKENFLLEFLKFNTINICIIFCITMSKVSKDFFDLPFHIFDLPFHIFDLPFHIFDLPFHIFDLPFHIYFSFL
jgi:hypothetical protein